MSSAKHSHAAREIQRLRTALATAEAERDAAHNEALEKAAEVAERDGSSHAAPYPHNPDWSREVRWQVGAADRIASTLRALKKETPNADK